MADRRMARARDEMVVDEAARLHVRVEDGRAGELEAPLLQLLRQGVGLPAARGDLRDAPPAVPDGLPSHEAPGEGVEGSLLLLQLQEGARVGHRGLDLLAV